MWGSKHSGFSTDDDDHQPKDQDDDNDAKDKRVLLLMVRIIRSYCAPHSITMGLSIFKKRVGDSENPY